MDEHLAFRRLYIAAILLVEQSKKHPQNQDDLAVLARYEQRLQQAALDYAVAARAEEFGESHTKPDGRAIAVKRIEQSKAIMATLRKLGIEDDVLLATAASRLLEVL